jgi:hypothetical protein
MENFRPQPYPLWVVVAGVTAAYRPDEEPGVFLVIGWETQQPEATEPPGRLPHTYAVTAERYLVEYWDMAYLSRDEADEAFTDWLVSRDVAAVANQERPVDEGEARAG